MAAQFNVFDRVLHLFILVNEADLVVENRRERSGEVPPRQTPPSDTLRHTTKAFSLSCPSTCEMCDEHAHPDLLLRGKVGGRINIKVGDHDIKTIKIAKADGIGPAFKNSDLVPNMRKDFAKCACKIVVIVDYQYAPLHKDQGDKGEDPLETLRNLLYVASKGPCCRFWRNALR
ncbi:MAG: hypothetical protein R2682_06225 [Pyrinomonadaceae bacterium]